MLEGDATRKLVRQVLGAIAEYDKAMLVSKLRAARERKRAREGKCEGRRRYTDTEEGREIIREVKRLRRKRPGCKAMSYEQIAKELNRREVRTLIGLPFTPGNVQSVLKSARGAS